MLSNIIKSNIDVLMVSAWNYNSTGASNRSVYPISKKTFENLETLLAIHRPPKVWSAGSLWGI